MRYVLLIISLLITAMLAGWLWLAPKQSGGTTQGLSFGEAQIGGPFSLIDQHQKPFTQDNLKGHYALVYFGFTHCPDICPTSLLIITNALKALGPDADKIVPVFITLDPERDTPKVMADYVSNFDPRMVGLSGSLKQVKQAADAYKVYFSKVEQKDSAVGYLVDHSGYIFFMGPDGKYLAHFPHNVAEHTLTSTLRKLMNSQP